MDIGLNMFESILTGNQASKWTIPLWRLKPPHHSPHISPLQFRILYLTPESKPKSVWSIHQTWQMQALGWSKFDLHISIWYVEAYASVLSESLRWPKQLGKDEIVTVFDGISMIEFGSLLFFDQIPINKADSFKEIVGRMWNSFACFRL